MNPFLDENSTQTLITAFRIAANNSFLKLHMNHRLICKVFDSMILSIPPPLQISLYLETKGSVRMSNLESLMSKIKVRDVEILTNAGSSIRYEVRHLGSF